MEIGNWYVETEQGGGDGVAPTDDLQEGQVGHGTRTYDKNVAAANQAPPDDYSHVVDKNSASAAIEQLISEAREQGRRLQEVLSSDAQKMAEEEVGDQVISSRELIRRIESEREQLIRKGGTKNADNQTLKIAQQELTTQLRGVCVKFDISPHQVNVIKPRAMNQATSTKQNPMPLAA